MHTIGIRREDKNQWEARVPVVPAHALELKEKHGIRFMVQPSPIRSFSEADYRATGAEVAEDLSDCAIVMGIKEMPEVFFLPGKTYLFFSHTIKGQAYNMPMLKKLMTLGCNLFDYEKITDENNRRLVFFGNYAGFAGMIDSLWALGQKLLSEGVTTPFADIKQALAYHDLEEARAAVAKVGERLRREGLPASLQPLVVGFAGYGNVSRGAQEILDLLPVKSVAPGELKQLFRQPEQESHTLYKVVFKEADMVEPLNPSAGFNLQEYYAHPENYHSRFSSYIPFLTMLVNGIYWEPRYPRLATKAFLKELFNAGIPPRLKVIGDISCDKKGAIECNLKITDSGNPVYVYNPETEEITTGVTGKGPAVLAVDNLPCELPRDSSTYFSGTLFNYIPELAKADFTKPFHYLVLPTELKKAAIVYHGELTPDFRYLEHFLK